MSSSIRGSLLLLLVVCFNNSTFADSLPPTLNSTNNFQSDSNNVIDINILFLSLVNDLPPPYTEKLFFTSHSFQQTPYELKPGKPYTTLSNFDVKDCLLIWKPRCSSFNLYDAPSQGGHQRIYYSVRKDGVYHSWDNANWNKWANWGSC
ncbi:hypothetical protein VNO77_11863 [Canavalia gladiata]|uniref:Uncharacterized protein n=1 Tax=Canavalia gladiata TaxID=3824 RepID=A0AAN9LZ83_CANGL